MYSVAIYTYSLKNANECRSLLPSDANIYGQRIPFLPLITATRSTLVVVAFVLSANCQGASLPFPSVGGGQGARLFVESEVNWTWWWWSMVAVSIILITRSDTLFQHVLMHIFINYIVVLYVDVVVETVIRGYY